MIQGRISGQQLSLHSEPMAGDSLNYLTAAFSFDGDAWSQARLRKFVSFESATARYEIELEDNKITADRGLNLSAGQWTVGVFGILYSKDNETVLQRITTATALLSVATSATPGGEPFPSLAGSVGEMALTIREVSEANASEAKQAAEAAATSVKRMPRIRENGNWEIWDSTQSSYVDSGYPSRGEEGFSPTVKDESTDAHTTIITITDAEGPHSFYIYNGQSPIIGENGNWYNYDDDSDEFVDTGVAAQGPQGDKGDKGDPGETPDISGKMDKANPTGTGALSMNRAADSEVGAASAAIGTNNTAPGLASIALGMSNEIRELDGAAIAAFVAGNSLISYGNGQVVLGKYNVPLDKPQSSTTSGRKYPFYPFIFGWGTSSTRKNLIVLDREGNIDFAGSAKANGEPLAPYPCETISGNPAATQIGAEGVPVKSLELTINPAQSGSGDPSPTNIRPIITQDTAVLTANGVAITAQFGQGIYGGVLNMTTGVLTVTHALIRFDDARLRWNIFKGYFYTPLPGVKPAGVNIGQQTAICSGYKRASKGTDLVNNAENQVFTVASAATGADVIVVRDNDYTDVASWLAAAGGYELVYELANPTQTIQLTPQEVRTVLGANSFSADTGDVRVTLRVDPTLALAELRAAILGSAE